MDSLFCHLCLQTGQLFPELISFLWQHPQQPTHPVPRCRAPLLPEPQAQQAQSLPRPAQLFPSPLPPALSQGTQVCLVCFGYSQNPLLRPTSVLEQNRCHGNKPQTLCGKSRKFLTTCPGCVSWQLLCGVPPSTPGLGCRGEGRGRRGAWGGFTWVRPLCSKHPFNLRFL